jgi:hypothetical protein
VTRKDSYLFSVIEEGRFLEEKSSTSKLKAKGIVVDDLEFHKSMLMAILIAS